jgi:NitT/TauT family transport system substrate-binding protein
MEVPCRSDLDACPDRRDCRARRRLRPRVRHVAPPTPHGDPTAPPTQLNVGLGYIPSVQFAPFYLAQQAGYYRDAGLEVTFENKIDPDLVTLVGQGAIDIGVADGTSVIPAVSQGSRSVHRDDLRTYPSIVFAKASSGITTRPTSRARRSASRASTARPGSCSRRS